jgi:hypothetical protein
MTDDEKRHSYDEILARLDERTENTDRNMVTIKKDVLAIHTKLSESYVTQKEFNPIKMLVYGAVGLVLTSVCGAVLILVINSGATH